MGIFVLAVVLAMGIGGIAVGGGLVLVWAELLNFIDLVPADPNANPADSRRVPFIIVPVGIALLLVGIVLTSAAIWAVVRTASGSGRRDGESFVDHLVGFLDRFDR